MTGIEFVGGDAELEHAGARHDPLDEIDLGLIDLRHDDLDLVEAEPAHRYLLLTARIHAPAHRGHELVHVDRIGPTANVEHDLVRGTAPRQRNEAAVGEIEAGDVVDEGLAGRGVGRSGADRDPAVGRAADARPLAPGHELLHPADAVVDQSGDLLDRSIS